jgi:hypothetical protein
MDISYIIVGVLSAWFGFWVNEFRVMHWRWLANLYQDTLERHHESFHKDKD